MTPLELQTQASPTPVEGRLRAAGKFFADDHGKVFLRGVTYGPFRPNDRGEPFPTEAQLAVDFEDIAARGFNTIRVYDPPSDAILSLCERLDLRLIVGIPWTDHVDFLADETLKRETIQAILTIVERFASHPCVAAFLVGNEIEKTLVRWMGPAKVRAFLEHLIDLGRGAAPRTLFSYATYPSTEYLVPRNADFLAVNVFLEEPRAFDGYARRLQHLAGDKPLLISEFGLDVGTHGESKQADVMRWQRDLCLQTGVAGGIWFSYTDEWFRGGDEVTGWHFGLTTRDRKPRPAADAHRDLPTSAAAPPNSPRISVIVCTRNGSRTLRACLESVTKLRYPDHEVIVIDDGSTDSTREIAREFPIVRYLKQEPQGLSVARNRGAEVASGDLLAYTDDDCVADPDWLLHLALAFDSSEWVAAGGPNIPPPPRTSTEAVVAASPGPPMHVMLNDVEAEHLPGCNLAIRKSALLGIGGFNPLFKAAGDDVDICWRLRDAGGRLRFAPGAMVWHHRRATVPAYLRQQRGYGQAEALLMKTHPSRFGKLGGAQWRGFIYGDWFASASLKEGTIHHGPQGNGLFQGVYATERNSMIDWLGGLASIGIAAVLAVAGHGWAALALVALSMTLARWKQAHLPPPPFPLSFRDRWLQWALCWLQPIVRSWARVQGALKVGARPSGPVTGNVEPTSEPPVKLTLPLGNLTLWSEDGRGRDDLLAAMGEHLEARGTWYRSDDGWRRFDLELDPHRDLSPALLTVTEYHRDGGRLTRVRLLWRLTPKIIGAFSVLLLLCLAVALLPFPLQHWIGSLAAASLLVVPVFAGWRAQSRLRRHIRQSAAWVRLEEQNPGL